MSLRAPQLAGWRITAPADEVGQHAVDELRRHLGLTATGAGQLNLQLVPDAEQHVCLHIRQDAIDIVGRTPRALVDGAAWLLELLGFYWVEPGERGHATDPEAAVEPGTYGATPAIERRTLVLGQDALHDDWLEWMEWASRNLYNDIFFHDTPPSVWDRTGKTRPTTADELAADGRGWLFERWDADGADIMAEARKRGMTVQFGGHHLSMLLPREHFEEHPDWFPERNGVRERRYNLCVSNPGAMAELQRNAELYFARFAGPDLYQVIGDDLVGGGWCACARCDGLSPSDQALRATNAVAEVLARINPEATILHIAYHDTLDVPASTTPLQNVGICFAPRERDYSYAIDGGYMRNPAWYWEPMLRLFDLFPREKRFVFEYYSDAILFKGLAPIHGEVLPEDIAAYQRAGVRGVANLMVGDRPWVGLPLHAWWFAQCAWDPAQSLESQLAGLSRAAFGHEAPGTWNAIVDVSMQSVLEREGMVDNPRGDVLDFGPNSEELLQLTASAFRVAADTMVGAVASWSELLPFPDLPEQAVRLQREMLQAEGTAAICRHLGSRVTALNEALHGSPGRARTALEGARTALAELEAWDAEHNTPAYAVITRRMRRWMHRHCDEIERMLAGPHPRPLSRPGGRGETAES